MPNTNLTGTLLPGTNQYRLFQITGSNPRTGTTAVLSYITTNPYGTNQYNWYIYIHNSLVGNVGFEEIAYAPYTTTGVPPGIAAFLQQYAPYLRG
jgi:hypothetical protein